MTVLWFGDVLYDVSPCVCIFCDRDLVFEACTVFVRNFRWELDSFFSRAFNCFVGDVVMQVTLGRFWYEETRFLFVYRSGSFPHVMFGWCFARTGLYKLWLRGVGEMRGPRCVCCASFFSFYRSEGYVPVV